MQLGTNRDGSKGDDGQVDRQDEGVAKLEGTWVAEEYRQGDGQGQPQRAESGQGPMLSV